MRKKSLRPVGFRVVIALLFVSLLLLIVHHEVSAQEARPTEALQPKVDALSNISAEESEERLKDAKILFDRGKTDAAIFMLQQLEKADPTNYKVLFKLGEIAIADRNWAYSISVLRKASLIRPLDIEVRLILIDIYKAYQMPIQSIIVAKEILVLDPNHLIGTQRLAELYQEQAMLEDEIVGRQHFRRIVPDDYDNLKRLAVIFDENGDLWESALIYEEIRVHHANINDMTRLVAIYDKLGESFRALEILEHIEKRGVRRRWLEERTIASIRRQNDLYDPFFSSVAFRNVQSDELKEDAVLSEMKYTHIRIRSSTDLGIEVHYDHFSYGGINDLAGDVEIHSVRLLSHGIKNWRGRDYQLEVTAGLLSDTVSGRLRLRDPGSGLTANDFPFLSDPTFDSYGGVMPLLGIRFRAQPGLHASYQLAYEHGLMEDLDARLKLFRFDKASATYSYSTEDQTLIQFSADVAETSDDNLLLHGFVKASYILWGSGSMLDLNGKRRRFFRSPPVHFLMAAYQVEYFNDEELSEFYETFDEEFRHQGKLLGQTHLRRIGRDGALFLNLEWAYGTGSTLSYQSVVESRFFYLKSETENEIGISYAYEESRIDDDSQQNLRIVGKSKEYKISVDLKWRF